MCGHYTGKHAVGNVCIFPVVEAEAEEEAPGGVEGMLLYDYGAQMESGGVEDSAACEAAWEVGAVVVNEALELLD